MANFEASYPVAIGGGGGGSGTVTSVGLTDSTGLFTISGSPVTTAGNLNLATFSLAFAANTALTGTYDYPVTVLGNASLSGNTTVEGDLIINGNLTNTGGRSLTVKGNLIISGGFLFTPISTATAQGNVTVGGNFNFGANSNFRVNPAQTPSLTVGGSIISTSTNFVGSGQAETSGLTVSIGGDASNVGFDLRGGDSANIADAGHGGTITVFGSCNSFSLHANGGDSGFNTFSAGSGGSANLYGDVLLNGNFSLNGGNVTVGNGNGGSAGIAQIGGKVLTVLTGSGTLFSLAGGSAISAPGGTGGQIYCDSMSYLSIVLDGGASTSGSGGSAGIFPGGGNNQNELITNCSLSAVGGAGGVNGGDAGSSACQGGCMFTSVNLNGGAGVSGDGGAGGALAGNGDLTLLGAFSADGGAGNAGTGTGGAGGSLTAQGSFTTNSTFSAAGGTGNTPGAAGTKTVNGNLQASTFTSATALPSTAGQFRLANTDVISWRNNNNNGNNALGMGNGAGGDSLTYFTGSAEALLVSASTMYSPSVIYMDGGIGTASKACGLFTGAASDTLSLFANTNGNTGSGAGIFFNGHTSANPDISEFWSAGAQTGNISATGQWTLGAASTTPQHALNTSTSAPAAGGGTLLNMPAGVSGNPTGYILISINGSNRVIPFW